MGWSNLLTFGLGLLSGLLLGEAHEHYRRRLSLSTRVYEPLHEQLVRVRPQFEQFRVLGENPVWSKVVESGLATKTGKRIRQKIEHLYETSLPAYYKAWTFANQHWIQVGEKWDARFGVPFPTPGSRQHFDWWSFLIAEKFKPPILNLGDKEAIPIFGAHIGAAKLAELELSILEFLDERWYEVENDPAFVNYRAKRRELLAEIDQTVSALDRLIIP